MRDLYRRLGVRPDCNSTELRAAIDACSHARLKHDAAGVLLRPERRRSYDNLRSVLVDIGVLRGRLGLTHTDHWMDTIASDFSPESESPSSRRAAFIEKIEQINRKAERRTKLSGLTKTVVLIVVVGFFVWSFNQETNRTHPPSKHRPQTNAETLRGNPERPLKPFDNHEISQPHLPSKRRSPPTVEATHDNPERLLETHEICEVQQLLAQESIYEGAIDGRAGPETLAAITAFYRLTQEGHVGQDGVQVNTMLLSDVRSAIEVLSLSTKRPGKGALLEPPNTQTLAPLSIKTPAGPEDYYIKLTRPGSKKAIIGFYVYGGSTREVEVPLGRYELKYATGTNWLNTRCLFGIETSTYKAMTILSFEQSNDGVRGYSVELIKQEGGNLQTRGIPPSEF